MERSDRPAPWLLVHILLCGSGQGFNESIIPLPVTEIELYKRQMKRRVLGCRIKGVAALIGDFSQTEARLKLPNLPQLKIGISKIRLLSCCGLKAENGLLQTCLLFIN